MDRFQEELLARHDTFRHGIRAGKAGACTGSGSSYFSLRVSSYCLEVGTTLSHALAAAFARVSLVGWLRQHWLAAGLAGPYCIESVTLARRRAGKALVERSDDRALSKVSVISVSPPRLSSTLADDGG